MSNTEQFNTDFPSMQCQRYGCAAAALRRNIFVLGGSGHKSGEMYDTVTKQWITLHRPMSTVRQYAAAVALVEDIVVMGGYDGNYNSLSSVEAYNTVTKQWSTLPPMKSRREGFAAGVLDGKMIVVGGRDGGNYLASVEEYNPTTQKWVTISPMHIRRRGCAVAVLGGKLYVMGGYNKDGRKLNYLSSVEVYDPTTKQWTLIADMSTARYDCAAASPGGKIVVVGGYDGSTRFSSCEEYDTTTQKWSRIASMNTKRSNCTAVEVEGSLYVMGGYDGSNELSSMELLLIQPNPQTQTRASPPAAVGSLAVQSPSSQLPHTRQLLQEKIPTADFVPVVAAEVIQAEENCISESLGSMSMNQNLSSASIEEVCEWLSRHGLSAASLDIIRQEEIDGVFLFTESFDEIKMMLKGEGMKLGQISRVRLAIEKAKSDGSLS